MSDGGPPVQAYNPNIQGGGGGGAAPGTGIGGDRVAIFAGVNDTQSAVPGAGIQHVMGFVNQPKAGVNSFISNKGPRTLSKGLSAIGIRTQVQFDGNIQDLTGGMPQAALQEIHGAGEQIHAAGGAHMGSMSEASLTGAAAITPPATPGMGADRGAGMEI